MKIVLILSDSLRYDHIGAFGLQQIDTPELDSLLADSVCFDRCYAGSFPTVPQRYDMLTGKLGFPFRGWERLTERDITIAEILLDNGYITQLITDSNEILRHEQNYNRGYLGHHLERGQERDVYFTKMNQDLPRIIPHEKARHSFYFGDYTQADLSQWVNNHWIWEEDHFPPRVAKMASKWIELNYKAEDFLLHLDFFDPHEPWDAPQYYVDKYDPDYQGTPMIMPNYGLAEVFTPEELNNMRARYKGEVEMVSKWIGFAIRKLKDVGIYDETMIIFTSDHGILLGEHNRTGKLNITKTDPRGQWPLFDDVVHVPLFIKMPGQSGAGKRVEELVQPMDITPTILDAAAIDVSKPLPGKAPVPLREIAAELKGIMLGRQRGLNPMDGKSLLPLVRGEKIDWGREFIFSSQRLGFINEGFSFSLVPEEDSAMFWVTVTGKDYVLLLGGRQSDAPELYNIKKDPGQTANLYEEERDKALEMTRALCDYLMGLGADQAKIDALRSRVEK